MSSRPESPIKQTFKKLLSPNKSKPPSAQPALTTQFPEHTNWTYPESTSSSNCSADPNTQYITGWNVIERPQTPTSGANKENVLSTKDVVEKVMGPSKLSKQKSKQLSKDGDLDRQFEELMVCPTIGDVLTFRTPALFRVSYDVNFAPSMNQSKSTC